ncbi:transglycosylase SLT domain-containing protein [Nocardia spumae]|uniref:lytic transglycosylase domain-containing protein n=1 Tax=Nocardia spumae TaxID=2887190 RepID=UPI001D14F456|nr:transglycosylase SLT domain-containing protein [Nocardia spumae]
MTAPGGAPTIPDVEKWDPEALRTAAAAVGKLSGDLDRAVLAAVDSTRKLGQNQQWGGGAAQAADGRMELEKGRASAVSQAVLGLQTAVGQQVENLENAKKAVLDARDAALHPSGQEEGTPTDGFEVADNGTVTANTRKKYWQDLQGASDIDKQNNSLREDGFAARHQLAITNALKQAELVAEAAITAVDGAKAPLDLAFAGLGDPVTGAGAAPPAPPAPTVPAATAPAATAPAPHNSGSPVSNLTSSHSGGNSSHSGGGYSSAAYSGSSSGSTSGPPPTAHPSGDVKDWIAQAKQVLIEMGYPPESIDENAIALIIEHESGGDPNAINNWDSNAAAGHPSKGLMQCIDSTFNAHAAPGHNDIWNPVDNIVAATRYSIDRYGSLDNVPGVSAVSGGSGYVGY